MSTTAAGTIALQLQTRDKKMAPMESQAQRRKLWATNPKVAQKFEDETPRARSYQSASGKR